MADPRSADRRSWFAVFSPFSNQPTASELVSRCAALPAFRSLERGSPARSSRISGLDRAPDSDTHPGHLLVHCFRGIRCILRHVGLDARADRPFKVPR